MKSSNEEKKDLEHLIEIEKRKSPGFFEKLKKCIVTATAAAMLYATSHLTPLATSGCFGRHKIFYDYEGAVEIYNGVLALKNQLIISFNGRPSKTQMEESIKSALGNIGFNIMKVNTDAHIAYIRITNDSEFRAAQEQLRASQDFKGVSLNLFHNIQSAFPNDPLYKPPGNWGYEDSGIEDIWVTRNNYGDRICINITDNSFGDAENHEDLQDIVQDVKRTTALYGAFAASLNPSIVIDESNNKIIVYEDNRNGDFDIYALFPNGTEKKLDAAPSNINSNNPSIAVGNSLVVAAYDDGRQGNRDIWMRIFDVEGNPLGNEIKVNQTDAGDQIVPIVHIINQNIVIAWQDYSNGDSNCFFRIFDSSGNPLTDEMKIHQSDNQEQLSPQFCQTDTGIRFVWTDSRNGNFDIYQRDFDVNGNPLNNESIAKGGAADQSNPQVGFCKIGDKGLFILTFEEGNKVHCKITDSDMNETEFLINDDPNSTQSNVSFSIVRNANDEHNIFFVFEQTKNGDVNILGKTYNLDNSTANDVFAVSSKEKNAQFNPAISSNGLEAVVSWVDMRNGNPDIYSRAFDADGTPFAVESRTDNAPLFADPNINHGMEVAGIFSKINNNKGVAGSNSFLFLKEYDGTARNLFERISEAITKNNCKLIIVPANIAWTKTPSFDNRDDIKRIQEYSKVWENVARLAAEYNTAVIVSAGNSQLDTFWTTGIPDDLRKNMPVFAVIGAYDSNNKIQFSGKNSDLLAPGSARVPTANNRYEFREGTSIATAFAGLAAAMLAREFPWLTPRQIRKFLEESGIQTGRTLEDLSGKEIPQINLPKAFDIANKNFEWSSLDDIVDMATIAPDASIVKAHTAADKEGNEYISLDVWFDSQQVHKVYLSVLDAPSPIEIASEVGLCNMAYDKQRNALHIIVDYYNKNPRELNHIIFDCSAKQVVSEDTILTEFLNVSDRFGNTYYKFSSIGNKSLAVRDGKLFFVTAAAYEVSDDPYADRAFGMFLFEKDGNSWKLVEKIPYDVISPHQGINLNAKIGELGDIHLCWTDVSGGLLSLYYARKQPDSAWEITKLADVDRSSEGMGKPMINLTHEIPTITYARTRGSNELKLISLKKYRGNWIEKILFETDKRAADDYFLNVDNDNRPCYAVFESDGTKIFVDRGGNLETKIVSGSLKPHSFLTKTDNNMDNVRVIYLLNALKISRLTKPDF